MQTTAISEEQIESKICRQDWIESCFDQMRDQAERGEEVHCDVCLTIGQSILPNEMVDLIYAEFVLRTQYGQPANISDYYRRFPDFEDRLRRQFEIDELLQSSLDGQDLSLQSLKTDSIPKQIDRYQILHSLGSGLQGNVYRAFDPELRRDVAIKIIREVVTGEVTQFHEAIVTAQLQHPCLASVLDVGRSEGRFYYVSHFLPGKTFDQWASTHRDDPYKIVHVVAELASALAYAHARGIMHLDIKPKNIIVDDHDRPHLLDFGLSLIHNASQSDQLENGMVRGTLQFMPPEQASGDAKKIGSKSDVFSLAATLVFGLTNENLYSPTDCPEHLDSIKNGEIQEFVWHKIPLPARAIRILRKAVSADQDRRPEAQQFAKELYSIFALPATRRSQHRWLALVCGFLFMVIGGIGVYALRARTATPVTAPGGALAVERMHEEGFTLLTEQSARIRKGDLVRIRGGIPAGKWGALYSIATDRMLQRLGVYSPQKTDQSFVFPDVAAGTAIKMEGNPGTELIVLYLGDKHPDVERESLENSIRESYIDTLPPDAILTTQNGAARVENYFYENIVNREEPVTSGTNISQNTLEMLSQSTRKLGAHVPIRDVRIEFENNMNHLLRKMKSGRSQVLLVAFRLNEVSEDD